MSFSKNIFKGADLMNICIGHSCWIGGMFVACMLTARMSARNMSVVKSSSVYDYIYIYMLFCT